MREPNPILARELKQRMRSMRSTAMLTVYLLLLGITVFATERLITRSSEFGEAFAAATAGRAVFHWMLFFMLLLLCFLVPGFTSGIISSERERQTFQLLQVTLLRPRSIIAGKLASSMLYLLLLIVATLPLVSVAFILGGVTPLDVLRGYGMVLLTGFTFGMIGIAISASVLRTLNAVVLSYALIATLVVGTGIAYGLLRAAIPVNEPFGRQPAWTLVLNPFIGTATAISTGDVSFESPSPFDGMASAFRNRAVFIDVAPVPGGPGVRRFGGDADSGGLPIWASTVMWYLGFAAVSWLVALRGVRAPSSAIITPRRGRVAATQ